MVLFYIILGLGVGGIGYVIWNLKNEQNTEAIFAEMEQETNNSRAQVLSQIGIEPKASSLPSAPPEQQPKKNIFQNLPLGNILKKNKAGEETPQRSINEIKNQSGHELLNPLNQDKESTGTAAIKITHPQKPSTNETNTKNQNEIDEEIDLALAHSELKEKHEKLDKLFHEKSADLEKSQKSLDQELKNRKEFNKVKDILEKEIKEVKDRLKEAQTESTNTASENERHKKRIDQLDQKISELEKANLSKENLIEELNKKISRKETLKHDPVQEQGTKTEPRMESTTEPNLETSAEQILETSSEPAAETILQQKQEQIVESTAEPIIINKTQETVQEPIPVIEKTEHAIPEKLSEPATGSIPQEPPGSDKSEAPVIITPESVADAALDNVTEPRPAEDPPANEPPPRQEDDQNDETQNSAPESGFMKLQPDILTDDIKNEQTLSLPEENKNPSPNQNKDQPSKE